MLSKPPQSNGERPPAPAFGYVSMATPGFTSYDCLTQEMIVITFVKQGRQIQVIIYPFLQPSPYWNLRVMQSFDLSGETP